MIFRILILSFVSFIFCFASYEKVSIGKIDKYYENKISKEQLQSLIYEIENIFETQLNMNLFDYSENGKKIELLYLPPNRLERKISLLKDRLEDKTKKVDLLNDNLPVLLEKLEIKKDELAYENTIVNNKIKNFNEYIQEINKYKSLSNDEHKKIMDDIKYRKKKLNGSISDLKKMEKSVQNVIRMYNNKINTYNRLISQTNNLNKKIESLSRGFKKVNGKTFGIKKIMIRTYLKDGKRVKEKKEITKMNKIEIYGFKNIQELKVILAHEISHLIGIPHINKKNALMNPILQKSQVKNLHLTKDDIKAFRKYF